MKLALYGVYMIENKSAKKAYVGVSYNINKRVKQHRNLLEARNHHCVNLLEDWVSFGKEHYKFYVLESLHPIHNGYFYERKWIKILTDFGYTLYNVKGHSKKLEKYNPILDTDELDEMNDLDWKDHLKHRLYRRALKLIDAAVYDFCCSDEVDASLNIKLKRIDSKRTFDTELMVSCVEKYKSFITPAGKRFLNNGEQC